VIIGPSSLDVEQEIKENKATIGAVKMVIIAILLFISIQSCF
jgi:uncharacterized membrane protein YwzB